MLIIQDLVKVETLKLNITTRFTFMTGWNLHKNSTSWKKERPILFTDGNIRCKNIIKYSFGSSLMIPTRREKISCGISLNLWRVNPLCDVIPFVFPLYSFSNLNKKVAYIFKKAKLPPGASLGFCLIVVRKCFTKRVSF